jgi:hypothetical protein
VTHSGVPTQSIPAPTRIVAICKADRPICPRCGHGVAGVPVSVPNATLITCRNRSARSVAGRVENHCSQHVAIVNGPGQIVLVLALTPQEARALSYGQRLELAGAELSPVHEAL